MTEKPSEAVSAEKVAGLTFEVFVSDKFIAELRRAGLVIMPIEATRSMTMAACDSLPSCEHVFGHAGEMLRNCYRKMVEAGAEKPSPKETT